jgi:hypothetical protein
MIEDLQQDDVLEMGREMGITGQEEEDYVTM